MNIKREINENKNNDNEFINSESWKMMILVIMIMNGSIMKNNNYGNKMKHIHNIHENYDNWYLRHEY